MLLSSENLSEAKAPCQEVFLDFKKSLTRFLKRCIQSTVYRRAPSNAEWKFVPENEDWLLHC
jgi:hypothetical protein